MFKKITTIFIMLLVLAGSAFADVTIPFRFVDLQGAASPGITEVEAYYQYSNGNVAFWKEAITTASESALNMVVPTAIPSGVSNYLVFFFREGTVPYVVSTNYYGTGTAPIYNVALGPEEHCIAEIRGTSILSVNEAEPLVFSVEAEIEGDVFSPFQLNGQWTTYVPAGHEDLYSADTMLTARFYDESGNLVYQTGQSKSLFAGSKELFEFSIAPYTLNPGKYTLKVSSEVTDNQCVNSASDVYEYEIELTVERDLNQVCHVDLIGLNTNPIDPVNGENLRVYGEVLTNGFLNGNIFRSDANVVLNIYSYNPLMGNYNSAPMYSAQAFYPVPNPVLPVDYEFNLPWSFGEGMYKIEVVGSSDCGAVGDALQTHSIEVRALPGRTNSAPVFDYIEDMRLNVGQTRIVDLSQYARDADNDPLTYGINVINSNIASCSVSGSILTCRGLSIGNTDARATAIDGNLAGTTDFNIEVTDPSINSAPSITYLPATIWMDMNTMIRLNLAANDPNGDTLTWSVSGNTNIGITIRENVATIAPEQGWIGTETVTFTVSDGVYSDSQNVDIVVSYINHAPVILSEPVESTVKLKPYVYDVEAFDIDLDTLTYSLTEAPEDMTINPLTGLIEWTPRKTGDYDVKIRVTDTSGMSAVQSYTLKVKNSEGDYETGKEETLLSRTRLDSENYYSAGDIIRVRATLDNTEGVDFEDLEVTASCDELDMWDSIGPFDLTSKKEAYQDLYLEIPMNAAKGTYDIRIVYSNDDFRRTVYREFKVI